MTIPSFIYLPENPYGIVANYYSKAEFVQLLRKHKSSPDVIQFLADMLED